MKSIIEGLSFFLEGAARIFDFAGLMSDETLHETRDGAAINKDWKVVSSDFKISNKNMREGIYGFKKKRNRKN
jgi:hypothetical protein